MASSITNNRDAMDILIEEMDGGIWSAALQNGKLEGLEIDSPFEVVRWGSVYWAKIKTIDKALDAVFVDLDGDNTGILYNKDVRITNKDGSITKGGDESISKILTPGDFIAVQAKSSYLYSEDEEHQSFENKIPQVSMDITMPGRYLIYCPLMNRNRLSTRIHNKIMREQMMRMLDNLEEMKGFILRAAAAHVQTDVLVREAKILKEAWEQMSRYLEGNEAALIMLGPDAVERTLSDQATSQIEAIEIVTMDHFAIVEEWCSIFAPDLVTKISPQELGNASEDLALFHERDIIGQIESLFHAYSFLPGGGNIIIQETAALTAIDVNKGADKRSHLAVNIEAAQEILRQIRLRNSGGIIVIDFLRLKDKKEENALKKALQDAADKDPCTVQIHGKTNVGLYELTRKRRTPALSDKFDGIIE